MRCHLLYISSEYQMFAFRYLPCCQPSNISPLALQQVFSTNTTRLEKLLNGINGRRPECYDGACDIATWIITNIYLMYLKVNPPVHDKVRVLKIKYRVTHNYSKPCYQPHLESFSYIGVVSSTCLGLSCKKLYAVHRQLHIFDKYMQSDKEKTRPGSECVHLHYILRNWMWSGQRLVWGDEYGPRGLYSEPKNLSKSAIFGIVLSVLHMIGTKTLTVSGNAKELCSYSMDG